MLDQLFSLGDDYDGWYGPLASIEDHDEDSALARLEYRFANDSEPGGDAAVRLPSGRYALIREYSHTGRPGGYNLSRVGRDTDPVPLLAEFLAESGVDEAKVLWTEFDGDRGSSSWGT